MKTEWKIDRRPLLNTWIIRVILKFSGNNFHSQRFKRSWLKMFIPEFLLGKGSAPEIPEVFFSRKSPNPRIPGTLPLYEILTTDLVDITCRRRITFSVLTRRSSSVLLIPQSSPHTKTHSVGLKQKQMTYRWTEVDDISMTFLKNLLRSSSG